VRRLEVVDSIYSSIPRLRVAHMYGERARLRQLPFGVVRSCQRYKVKLTARTERHVEATHHRRKESRWMASTLSRCHKFMPGAMACQCLHCFTMKMPDNSFFQTIQVVA